MRLPLPLLGNIVLQFECTYIGKELTDPVIFLGFLIATFLEVI